MALIGNKEIPNNKNVWIGLTNFFGIGRSTARKITNALGIENNKKVGDLSENEIKSIVRHIEQFYVVEGKLKEKIQKIISGQIQLGTYRGLRRMKKLPVNGQRTRHNAQTAKKGGAATRKKVAVAGKKKAPTPK